MLQRYAKSLLSPQLHKMSQSHGSVGNSACHHKPDRQPGSDPWIHMVGRENQLLQLECHSACTQRHIRTHKHTCAHTKAAGTQEVEAHGSVPEIQDPVSKQTQRLQAPSVPLNYAGRSAPCACVEHRAWQSPGSPKAPLSQIPSKGCQPACLQLLSTHELIGYQS